MAKTVQKSILNEIKEAKYYAIMFDCTPDVSYTEQMSQVIQYVKKLGNECEIMEVGGKSGEYLSQLIVEKLALVDLLDTGHYCCQSYDSCSNMAGLYKGVVVTLTEMNKLYKFVPCFAHFLNLGDEIFPYFRLFVFAL